MCPVLYGTAVAVYLAQVLPGTHSFDYSAPRRPSFIRTYLPRTDFVEAFTIISPTSPTPNELFPPTLKVQVLNLASANLICSVALTGVMGLQAARWWAESSDPEQETEDLQDEESKPQKTADTKRRRGASVASAGQSGTKAGGNKDERNEVP